MQTKKLSLCEARISGSLEGGRGCRVTQVTKCRFSRLRRGEGRRWPWKPWLLRAGVRSGRAAACLIDGLVLWDATGAEMLWPSEEVLTASHRAVVLPWNAKVGECKLGYPPALPTHGDHPPQGLFLEEATGSSLLRNPVLELTLYREESSSKVKLLGKIMTTSPKVRVKLTSLLGPH